VVDSKIDQIIASAIRNKTDTEADLIQSSKFSLHLAYQFLENGTVGIVKHKVVRSSEPYVRGVPIYFIQLSVKTDITAVGNKKRTSIRTIAYHKGFDLIRIMMRSCGVDPLLIFTAASSMSTMICGLVRSNLTKGRLSYLNSEVKKRISTYASDPYVIDQVKTEVQKIKDTGKEEAKVELISKFDGMIQAGWVEEDVSTIFKEVLCRQIMER